MLTRWSGWRQVDEMPSPPGLHQLVHQRRTTVNVPDLDPRRGPTMDKLQVVAECCL